MFPYFSFLQNIDESFNSRRYNQLVKNYSAGTIFFDCQSRKIPVGVVRSFTFRSWRELFWFHATRAAGNFSRHGRGEEFFVLFKSFGYWRLRFFILIILLHEVLSLCPAYVIKEYMFQRTTQT